ncbi:uncharacterized protein [Mytilus edulis]|uniref:uncharacterized protein n=1 Tax=Mytilus edulis TaxID=6550 RepID=UPI0039EF0F40
MAADKKIQINVCCSIHSDEECAFVCGDCTELICDYCVGTKTHEDHGIKSIKKFIKEVDLDDFKESCENKALLLNKTEKRFQKAIDEVHAQSSQMISEIIKIKKKKLRKCEKRRERNAATLDKVIAVADPTNMIDTINNLPNKGGRTQYAELAQGLLKCHKTEGSKDLETNCSASVYLPTLKRGTIQTSRLKKLFGKLNFEKVDVQGLIDSDEDSTDSSDNESDSSDDVSDSSDD